MKKGLRYLAMIGFLSCASVSFLIAQPTLDFTRTIGGAANDIGTGITLDASGNILTTGKFSGNTAIDFNPGGTALTLTSATGPSDLYIAKYSSLGTVATGDAFKVGAASTDASNKIYIDPSGNVFVVGVFAASVDFDKSTGFVGFQNGGAGKTFIAKYDGNLGIQYTMAIGDNTTEIKDIAVDGSGNIYITGQFSGTVNFNPGTVPGTAGTAVNLTSNGGLDIFIAKYSAAGACQWAIKAGAASSDAGLGIDYDNSGNVYVTGFYRGVNVEFNPLGTSSTLTEYGGGAGSGDAFVAKYSSTGLLSSIFTLGNALFDQGTSITVDKTTGDFAITGSFQKDVNPIDFDPGVGSADATGVGISGSDMFVAKYSTALAYQWHKTVGSTGNEKGTQIKLVGTALYVTGSYEGTLTDFGDAKKTTSAGGLDAFIAGYYWSPTATDTCLFAVSSGGATNDEGNGIAFANNKIAVTGYNNTANQDIFFSQYSYTPPSACTNPVITTQPVSITRCTGTSAPFTVVATGATSYQWKKGGVNVSTGTGGTTDSYTISPVAAGDLGSYTVDVTNACGTVTSTAATLTVNAAVSISSQPSDLTRCTGTSANFAVTAAGFGTLTYQWKKGGVNVSTGTGGTTASYTISPVSAGDAASYTVDVTNTCGTVTSNAAALTVNAAVSISSQPSDLTRCTGTSANFAVTAAGFGTLTYQWKKGGVNVSTGTGATTASYTISPVAAGDLGSYTVDVTNTCGTVTSNAATLTVNAAVSISAQPSDLTRCTGTSANFAVTASGFGTLTYQWKKGGVNVSTGTGGTTASYTISSVSAGDAASYTVDVTNTCGTVTSNAAALTVNAAVSISSQPSDLTRCTGTSANFAVTAAGFGTLTYQWKKGGVNVSTGTGATTASYTISPVAAGDLGSYTVDVTNTCGTVTSNAATLTVNAAVSISSQPSDLTRCTGTSANFAVTASGFGTLTYQWKKGGVNVSTGTGGTTASYTISSVSAGDAASYTVDVTNTCGTVTSNVAALTVNAAVSISSQPSDLTRCTGTSANFAVTASGFGTLTYQWKKGGVNVSTGTGGTTASYTISPVAAGDLGNYTVDVTNTCGTVTSNAATLTVNAAVSISSQPSDLTRCTGTSANFAVTAAGSGTLTYQWKKGGVNVSTGTGGTTASYTISPVAAGDLGNYTVDVTNTCGTVTSNTAALTVNAAVSISSQPSDLTRCTGTSANFAVTAAGSGTLTYQWKKGGVNVSTGTGGTTASYTISSVAAGDQANYTVDVTNTCGTVTSNAAALTVNAAVSITTQPVSITRCTGTSAPFTVVATGFGTLAYQWKKGGVNVSTGTGGTTASYTISPVSAGDAASYTVDVTNTCGTVTSNAATLTVNAAVSISTQPSDLTRCAGTSANFAVTASGFGTLTYQWKKGGVNVSTGTGGTTASYTISPVAVGDQASYTVDVTNTCGTVTSNAAALTVNTPVTSNAGVAQTICNVTTTNLSGNNPSPGTGVWTVLSGTGIVSTPASPTSGVSGLTIGSSSTFTWTITNGACVSTSNVTVTVSSPAIANAGPDQALCNTPATTLAATGTGTWSTFSGTGTAVTPSNANSAVNGLTIGGSTIMRWTVTNGACVATSDMIISVSAPGTANAGSDQALCNATTTTLAAAGSGTWTTTSGTGVVTNPNSATSGVTGLTVGSTTVLTWTVSAGACSGTDQVSIVVSAPATGSAGASQNLCGATTATLAATGTGTWVKTSGTGTVTTPSSATSGVTGLTVGASSVFEWTVTNGACSNTTSTTIVSNAPVSITTQPASLTTLCSGNTFNLNVVATGSGTLTYQWKKGASNANGTSTASSYSIPSVVFGDAANYTVEVTNACGTVTSSVAQLVIQNLAINTQPVSQTVCPGANVTFTVAATGPSVSYQWKKDNVDLLTQTNSSLTLNGVSASDAASYTVLVSGCSNSILSNAAVLALSVCTGIEDETNNYRFRIYPNPAITSVHLNGFAQDPIRSIMVIDVNGEVVYQEKELNASSHELSVTNFAQGLYHVILFTASGNKWVEKVEVVK